MTPCCARRAVELQVNQLALHTGRKVRGAPQRPLIDEGFDADVGVCSAKECARIAALGLALLADARSWTAAQAPQLASVPVEAMAFSAATVSPWRSRAELTPACGCICGCAHSTTTSKAAPTRRRWTT